LYAHVDSPPREMNVPPDSIEGFITRWQGREGGQERANYGLFLSELCDAIGVSRPQPASATTEENDYVFERAVKEIAPDGAAGTGRIDLYKKGCFVLEAKQSRQPGGTKEIATQPELFPRAESRSSAPQLGVRTATRAWDVLMRNARVQAERYARALPVDHGWPPFILICDACQRRTSRRRIQGAGGTALRPRGGGDVPHALPFHDVRRGRRFAAQ
jgi:hypothetical protein